MKTGYWMKTAVAVAGLWGTLAMAQTPAWVPLPKQVRFEAGGAGFEIGPATTVRYEVEAAKPAAELFALGLRDLTGRPVTVSKGGAAAGAIVFTGLANRPKEGYALKVEAGTVRVGASANGGWFYGGQTLLQMIPQNGPAVIPAAGIEDEPVFPWRGAMLDVSRYFFTKEYVLRYLDMMAMHKLNVFHWHLVDDCGWRVEIKKYPKLTEIGAFRGKGEQRYGGFYSQADIREVVAYAAARNIEVVPEIEVPAHTLSALCAYPWLGCTGKQFEVPTRHSISPEIYCVGQETTWKFLDDVFDEVVALFPSRWVHIGGDEARYDRWKQCPHCQKVIQDEKLGSEKQLQGWTTRRLAGMLEKKGRRILGWSEVLDAGAGNDVGLMIWHDPKEAKSGAEAGHPIIASNIANAYIDTPESKLPGEPPAAAWLPPVPLRNAYEWDPVPDGLTGEAAKRILGPNACLWADRFLHNPAELADKPGQGTRASEAYMDYLSLPRLAALAEVGWTPRPQRNYDQFLGRMEGMYVRYLKRGYQFRVPVPLVKLDQGKVDAKSPVAGGEVRYTLDGSRPDENSPRFEQPLELKTGQQFQAITWLPQAGRGSLVAGDGATRNPFPQLGTMFGAWKSGQPGDGKPKEMVFDATGLIDRDGDYEITFRFTEGRHRLEIDGIEVLRNDTEVVAEDKHHGITGATHRDNTYQVRIGSWQTGASFKVRAMVYGDTGNDSNGVVLIRRK